VIDPLVHRFAPLPLEAASPAMCEALALTLQGETLVLLLKLLGGLLVFLAFWLVSAGLQLLLERLAQGSDQRKADVLRLLSKTSRVALLILGGITALGTMGIDVSALLAGLGLTGFALGFALRDALSNFLAGALILIYRPFRRGERIRVKDFEGTVVEIDLRYTTLQAEGRRFLIPNSVLFTETVTLLESPA
jgi:small conductance mechanosensitive channel